MVFLFSVESFSRSKIGSSNSDHQRIADWLLALAFGFGFWLWLLAFSS